MANRPDLTLDPSNWETIRALGHRMVDDMMDMLQNVRREPVWRPLPEVHHARFDEDLPYRPKDPVAVYQEFKSHILPYPTGNAHPRFWGWVMGGGTPVGALAEMLAAAMNANVCMGEHAAMQVEGQVVKWCKQLLDYPETASGLLTSGASMANLTALYTALYHESGGRARTQGLQQKSRPMVLYCSTESHGCIQRAAEIMGLGAAAVRKIPIDHQYRMRTDLLEQTIRTDLAGGFFPFCIVGNAGTVNTGAIDPLDELLAISRRHDLWFHIDGAFGALAKKTPEYEQALRAIEAADSVAFDLHKWMHIPYEAGCVLVRNAEAHRLAFEQAPHYLLRHERGISAGEHSFGNYGPELSRGFKALKVWMSMKTYGVFAYLALIRQNIAQARYLANRIQQHPELELLAPAGLNIVCFRYARPGHTEKELRALNREILMRLQEEGIATISATLLDGRYALRAAICNHRTRMEDLDTLVEAVTRLGADLNF